MHIIKTKHKQIHQCKSERDTRGFSVYGYCRKLYKISDFFFVQFNMLHNIPKLQQLASLKSVITWKYKVRVLQVA